MIGAIFFVLAATLVAGFGFTVAATLHLRGFPEFVLAAYVIAFAEIVVLILALSAFEAVTRAGVLVGAGALLVASGLAWNFVGKPSPSIRRHELLRCLRALTGDHRLLALAVTAGLALLYACALIVGTPPNSHDALTYHLARAAFWRQDGGVGYVTNAYDERLNVNPPNAEIVLTFLLEVGRNERFVGFVQFSAALVLTLGVYALARGVNLSRREAAVGALLFLTLPIVLLQSSTPQNDLVAASFLLSATVFLVHGGRVGLVLAGLATALAIGTKIPTAYGLPVLVTLALVIPPRTAWKGRIASISIGAALGSYWYVVNVVRTGRPLGDLPEEAPGLVAILDPVHNFFSAFARFIDAFDLSGAWGPNVLIYAIVAVAVVTLLLVRSRNKGDSKPTQTLATGALIIIPLMLIPVSYVLRIVFEALGGPDAFDDRFLPLLGWGKTVASDTVSWFGAIGLLFVVGMAIVVPTMVRRGALPSYAAALVAAPLLWFGLFAVTLGYDITQGRFFIFPVALSASLWGLVLRVDRYAVATVAIASTTASLTLVNFLEKPSGIRLLEADASATVWGVQRWKAQSIPEPDTRAALRFLDGIPPAATVALALEFNDFGYPAFGPSLERHVELVAAGSGAEVSDANWLLANPDRAPEIDRMCWRVVLATPKGWTGFRRDPAC